MVPFFICLERDLFKVLTNFVLFLNFANPETFVLFGLISVIVSLSFAPILLSVGPTPIYNVSETMSLKEVFRISPFSTVTIVISG